MLSSFLAYQVGRKNKKCDIYTYHPLFLNSKMEIFRSLPDICQSLVVDYWINSYPKSQIVWFLHNRQYLSPDWKVFNMIIKDAYVINDGISLLTFDETYHEELHNNFQTPMPLIKFDSEEFYNLLKLIGNNAITFKCLEIRGLPSPNSWRSIQMFANGCETIKIKSDSPFEALMCFDDSMFKKLIRVTKITKSDSNQLNLNSTRIKSISHYNFDYVSKNYSIIHLKFGSPDGGVIEINGLDFRSDNLPILLDQINHLKKNLRNFKFKLDINSEALGGKLFTKATDIDFIYLKVLTKDFDWELVKHVSQKITRISLESILPQNFCLMFPNLRSLTLNPTFNSNLSQLMRLVPHTVTNLHLDLSRFINGFDFKIPSSILFLEIMVHYLPFNHRIDANDSNLEVLVMTFYSEFNQRRQKNLLKITRIPDSFHFMEIRKCFKSDFVQINPTDNQNLFRYIELVPSR